MIKPSSVTGYRNHRAPLNVNDLEKIINQVPVLTKLGGACLVCGKFVGVLAIPAVFIPELNSLAIFLVISWGGLVFTSIALCSYEHFRKKSVQTDEEKLALINDLIYENPNLRHQLEQEIEHDNEPAGEVREQQNIIRLLR